MNVVLFCVFKDFPITPVADWWLYLVELYHHRLCDVHCLISSAEILCIDICITGLLRSKWSVKDTDGQPGSIGCGPTNFIPTAAYSECITIPLSRLYLTLWMCHVHRDGSFWIRLMQHSQTSVEPHIHLKKKKNVMQALLLTVKIPQLLASPSCKSRCDCCSWPMCCQTGKVLLYCP